ncbi:hypothetical protein [Flavobacterium sp. DSR3-2]|uniref:hypothetical protein n=1 Tax=Flavobacterium sp. DSR3-2 TaxID=2804634 RepID=UPI003CEA8A4C
MKKMRKIYGRVFKEKAVQLSYERHNISELARELVLMLHNFISVEKNMKSLGKEVFLVTAM